MGSTGIKEKKGTEEIFKEIMIENSPELMAASKPQMWEAQKTLSIINTKNMYTWADHSQITENQRLRENLREEDLCLFTDIKYFRLGPGKNV